MLETHPKLDGYTEIANRWNSNLRKLDYSSKISETCNIDVSEVSSCGVELQKVRNFVSLKLYRGMSESHRKFGISESKLKCRYIELPKTIETSTLAEG